LQKCGIIHGIINDFEVSQLRECSDSKPVSQTVETAHMSEIRGNSYLYITCTCNLWTTTTGIHAN